MCHQCGSMDALTPVQFGCRPRKARLQGPDQSELQRDFTFIDDIVEGIMGSLAEIPPSEKGKAHYKVQKSSPPPLLVAVNT